MYEHITPVLIKLHWLPIEFRIQFKVLLLVYKALKGIAPKYIKDQISDQTGFISNRFIGENTRLLYDTITYVEEEQLPGLLIIVDYAKAFDTIEWGFIDEVFKMFGFGPNFLHWIKLPRENSRSKIEQNDFFSDHISLSRGCRQGDPISPYVLVLCAEILSHVIREKRHKRYCS